MSFTIAHDFENSRVAHMTGTGIVFIEYIGSIFEPHKFTLSARDNTLYDIFSGKLVKDPFNLAKATKENQFTLKITFKQKNTMRA